MKRWIFLGILIIVIIPIINGMYRLGWMKFFLPREQNIQREVFENTKSYTHGKIQDLAKYYREYQNAETIEDKETIHSLVQMEFSDFDDNKIINIELKEFLIKMRGF